ncbi:hypothetical protein AB0308_001252 [Listeria monocytogenes]|nr:hypothetical protein [Listeria monocytogenes]EEJ0016263.1 hypothetical protein [Listeria innocua]EEJ1215271.1 hypothetical protein [Listeria innocua]HBN5100586.1 hypothetical protein [Listeria innocua]HBN5103478.1 hypothetical protein [Listeria innocua]
MITQQKLSFENFREKVADEIVYAFKSPNYSVDFAMAYITKDLYEIHERYLETSNCTELHALVMAEEMFLNQREDIAMSFKQYLNNF